jgi:hypothetical protein
MNLNIKFELNKELDKQIAFAFLNRVPKSDGVDFAQGIINLHPELTIIKTKEESEKKEIISKYFDKYYNEYSKELESKAIEAKKEWSKAEDKFIKQINKIFKNPTLTEGGYVGYVSAINCNPRFLDSKTFQFFYKHRDGSNMIIAHETLHFFFFDYAVKKHSDVFKGLNTNSGVFWMLSEIFNDVILSLPEFIEIHGRKDIIPYPAHKKYIEYMKKLWTDNPDIDNWLLEGYKYLNKENNKN